MLKLRKISDIFKLADRGKSEVKQIKSLWSYFYRDIIHQRGITLSDHNGYINRWNAEANILGKAASTERGNINSRTAVNNLTWKTYVNILKLYRCQETLISIEHKWPNGQVTYHYRKFIHRKKGLIVIDEDSKSEDDNKF